MSDTPEDDSGGTEPPKTTRGTGSEPVNRDMVKEIVMEVLSGLQGSSSKQSGNDDATRKEAGKSGKYGLALGCLRV